MSFIHTIPNFPNTIRSWRLVTIWFVFILFFVWRRRKTKSLNRALRHFNKSIKMDFCFAHVFHLCTLWHFAWSLADRLSVFFLLLIFESALKLFNRFNISTLTHIIHTCVYCTFYWAIACFFPRFNATFCCCCEVPRSKQSNDANTVKHTVTYD